MTRWKPPEVSWKPQAQLVMFPQKKCGARVYGFKTGEIHSDLIVINSDGLIVIDNEYLDLRFETDDGQHLMKQRYFEDHPA